MAQSRHGLGIVVAALFAGIGVLPLLGTGGVLGNRQLVGVSAVLLCDRRLHNFVQAELFVALEGPDLEFGIHIIPLIGKAKNRQGATRLNWVSRGIVKDQEACFRVQTKGRAAYGRVHALITQRSGIVPDFHQAVGHRLGLRQSEPDGALASFPVRVQLHLLQGSPHRVQGTSGPGRLPGVGGFCSKVHHRDLHTSTLGEGNRRRGNLLRSIPEGENHGALRRVGGDIGRCNGRGLTHVAQLPHGQGFLLQVNVIQLRRPVRVGHHQALIDAVVHIGHGKTVVVGKPLADVADYLLPQRIAHAGFTGHIGGIDFPHRQSAIGTEDVIVLGRPLIPVHGGPQEGHSGHIRILPGNVKGGNRYGSGFKAVQINQRPGIGNEHGVAKGNDRNGIAGAVFGLHLHGRRSSQIQEAVAGGAFGSQGSSESIRRVDFIDVAHLGVIAVHTVKLSLMIAPGRQAHIGIRLDGIAAGICRMNRDPVGTGLVRNLGIYRSGNLQKRLYRHCTGGRSRNPCIVFCHGGSRDDSGTCLDAGHNPSFIHRRHRRVTGAPDEARVIGGGQHPGFHLQGVLFIYGRMGGL
ncbi:unknown [Firmicutes bacterium CAG:137]|nr:unknown [Firmicutes bacterium CAG:137]